MRNRRRKELEQDRIFEQRMELCDMWCTSELAWCKVDEIVRDGERLIAKITLNGRGARVCTR